VAASFAEFRDVVVIGGGCYGTFYLDQLCTARGRGLAAWRRLILVDRNPACAAAQRTLPEGVELVTAEWGDFLGAFLRDGDRAEGDRLVPSPLMPHLLLEWLVRRVRERTPQRRVTVGGGAPCGTPFESVGPDGTRYVSHADWLCPVHCIEPAICPAIRAPRTWDMSETCRAAAPIGATVAVFACHHAVFGVGMIDVSVMLAANAALARAGEAGTPLDVLVGTVSRCHGAVTRVALDA